MTTRPLAVTAVCLLGAVAVAVTAVLLLANPLWLVPPTAAQRLGGLAAAAATGAALYGMWRMRRWGVWLLGALFLVRLAVGVAGRMPWSLPALAAPVVLLLVGLAYVRKMA
jgi:hypothetical protein